MYMIYTMRLLPIRSNQEMGIYRGLVKDLLTNQIVDALWDQVSGAHYIFNHTPKKGNDRKRLQCNLHTSSQYMQQFHTRMLDRILEIFAGRDLHPSCPVILKSLQGCQEQAAHCDYIPDQSFVNCPREKMPYLVIIATQPKTTITIWPGSGGLLREPCKRQNHDLIVKRVIKMDCGDVFVFRADIIHAGSEYDHDNVRLHMYMDSDSVPRKPNRTWVVHEHGDDDIKRVIVQT